MHSDPGDENDNKDVPVLEGVPVDDESAPEQTVELAEILMEYRNAILDLHQRVSALEARPQFAASIRTRAKGRV